MGKLLLRWQVAVALIGLIAAWAILTINTNPTAPATPPPAATTPISLATPAPNPAGDSVATSCTIPVPQRNGVLVEGIVGSPLYPNPLLADGNPVDRQIVDLVFDGLVSLDAAGTPQPALARQWSISEDGRNVRFDLRADVTWHDGAPFGARDVAFTYGLLQAEAADHPDALLWRAVTINVIDDQTIEFTLESPYAPFIEATARGILPAHLLDGVTLAQLAGHPFNNRPVGSGPFVVASDWLATGVLRLEPNPARYDRNALFIGTIEQRFFADDAARTAALAAGEINLLVDVAPDALPAILELPGVRLFTSTGNRYTELLFNLTENALTSSVELRQALALAIDRTALVERALNGQGVPFDGPFLPSSWAFVPELTIRDYDPEAAATLLDEADWPLDDAGSARVRTAEDGTPLALTVRLLLPTSDTARRLADGLAAQWGAAGIAVVPTIVDPAGLRAALASGAFDVALLTIDPLADPDLYDFWSQEAIISGQNYGGWNNRRASEALELARQLWDPAARYPYYVTFARAFDEALPALPLYRHVWTVVAAEGPYEATTGRPADLGFIARPRDRFAGLPDWTLGFDSVAVPCTSD